MKKKPRSSKVNNRQPPPLPTNLDLSDPETADLILRNAKWFSRLVVRELYGDSLLLRSSRRIRIMIERFWEEKATSIYGPQRDATEEYCAKWEAILAKIEKLEGENPPDHLIRFFKEHREYLGRLRERVSWQSFFRPDEVDDLELFRLMMLLLAFDPKEKLDKRDPATWKSIIETGDYTWEDIVYILDRWDPERRRSVIPPSVSKRRDGYPLILKSLALITDAELRESGIFDHAAQTKRLLERLGEDHVAPGAKSGGSDTSGFRVTLGRWRKQFTRKPRMRIKKRLTKTQRGKSKK
jgi:hypothetical protein